MCKGVRDKKSVLSATPKFVEVPQKQVLRDYYSGLS
jgi:hypothetical protein